MLSALLIIWLISLPLVLPFAGYSVDPPLIWHPASLVSSALVLGSRRILALLAAIAMIALGLGGYFLATPWSIPCTMLFLSTTIPLPFFLIDVIRRDRTLKNVHYVFWNAASPLAMAQERRILEGQTPDTMPQVAFYISEADWSKIPHITPDDKKYLERFHRGGGLYVAPATNAFLQSFDGLQLHPYLLNSDNASALKAFEQALNKTGARTPAAAMLQHLPAQPPPARTPPPSTWHALARKLPQTPDEDAEEETMPTTVEVDRKHSAIDKILAPPSPVPRPANLEDTAQPPMAKKATKPEAPQPPRVLKKITS